MNLNFFAYDKEEYYYLNITSNMRNSLAEENKELIHFSMQDENTSMYRFKSINLAGVKFIEKLFDAENIISISIDAPTK